MWLIVIVLICVIIYCYRRDGHVRRLVDRLPGPKPYPLVGNIPQVWGKREDLFGLSVGLQNEFKNFPIARAWFGWVPKLFVLKAKAAEAILSSNHMIDKSDFYLYLQGWLGTGLLTSTGSKWHSRRKLLTPTFHFKILEEYFPIIVEQSNVLLSILEQKVANDGPTLDIYPYLARCTLDVICETAMGKNVSAQKNIDSPYVNAVNNMGELVMTRQYRPWLNPNWIFSLTSLGSLQRKSLKLLHGFTEKVIREKRNQNSNGNSNQNSNGNSNQNSNGNSNQNSNGKSKEWSARDIGQKRRLAFLDLLLDESSNLSERDIREEVDTFMLEGHDTTASGINWTLYNIAKHPHVQAKVRSELHNILKDDINRSLTNEDIRNMKYLENVIKESMRLYPPVPYYARKLANDSEICGETIPAGVEIVICPYIIHRDPDCYPEPDKFDPDRFSVDNQKFNRNPYAYVPFSAGPRNCIGQKFALMEEKVVVAQIVRRFWITLMQPETEPKLLAELILRPANGMWLTLKQMSIDHISPNF